MLDVAGDGGEVDVYNVHSRLALTNLNIVFQSLIGIDHCVLRGSSDIWWILSPNIRQLSNVPIALFLKFRSPLFFHRITDNLTCHNWGDGNYVRGLQHLQLLSAAAHSLSLSFSFSLVSHLFFFFTFVYLGYLRSSQD